MKTNVKKVWKTHLFWVLCFCLVQEAEFFCIRSAGRPLWMTDVTTLVLIGVILQYGKECRKTYLHYKLVRYFSDRSDTQIIGWLNRSKVKERAAFLQYLEDESLLRLVCDKGLHPSIRQEIKDMLGT